MSIKKQFEGIIEEEFQCIIEDLENDIDIRDLMNCMLRANIEVNKINCEVKTEDGEIINAIGDKVYYRIFSDDKAPVFGHLKYSFKHNKWTPSYDRAKLPIFAHRDNYDKYYKED